MDLTVKIEDVFSVKEHNFNELALEIFHFQAQHCTVYRNYLSHLGIQHATVQHISAIPFLPVELFKTHKVVTGQWQPTDHKCFKSSATTQKVRSCHYYNTITNYEYSLLSAFDQFYGKPSDWEILALLPGYSENPHASLIYMVSKLMLGQDNFYLNNLDALQQRLFKLKDSAKKCMLIGVSHALLDFGFSHAGDYQHVSFMETGGMKGRKREMTRLELHQTLQLNFNVDSIHSEYGMTELFSQAYSLGSGLFKCPPWMQIIVRQMDNPMGQEKDGRSGGINVLDLVNIESCCFIATSDIGKRFEDGTFEVLGRFDHSEVRGCNILIN